MAEVKWIKITTDMFDNRKIKFLRKLPEGNSIVLIWVMLLTMAGRCNAGGMVFLTENIPYTTKMLADELDFDENTVILALQSLEQLQMVTTSNGTFSIAGWEEYQNIEGMDKIKEQNRIRKQKQRERERRLLDDGSHVTSRDSHATDIEEERDIDKEDKGGARKRFSPPSLGDVSAYIKEKGYCVDPNKFMAHYESNGWMVGKTKMKDWKAAVRSWHIREAGSKPTAAQDPHKGQTAHCPHCGSAGQLFWRNTQTGKYYCQVCRESVPKDKVVWT